MNRDSIYYRQVQLLIRLLPLVAEEDCFVLKGGTAINLFVRDLPRLSVDIDLVYLPMQDRETALTQITAALTRIGQRIQHALPAARLVESFRDKADALRLIVAHDRAQVKIELSPVLRGTVFESERRRVCKPVEAEFGYAEMCIVSFADLYAGKLCAALDRQHPRDWFDVRELLGNEGLTDAIRRALLVYLASHARPIAELLNPHLIDLQKVYAGEFRDMIEHPVSLGELETTRTVLIEKINAELTDPERRFLLSFKNKAPDWSLIDLPDAANLPAVQWKLKNLHQMPPEKHKAALNRLQQVLMPATRTGEAG